MKKKKDKNPFLSPYRKEMRKLDNQYLAKKSKSKHKKKIDLLKQLNGDFTQINVIDMRPGDKMLNSGGAVEPTHDMAEYYQDLGKSIGSPDGKYSEISAFSKNESKKIGRMSSRRDHRSERLSKYSEYSSSKSRSLTPRDPMFDNIVSFKNKKSKKRKIRSKSGKKSAKKFQRSGFLTDRYGKKDFLAGLDSLGQDSEFDTFAENEYQVSNRYKDDIYRSARSTKSHKSRKSNKSTRRSKSRKGLRTVRGSPMNSQNRYQERYRNRDHYYNRMGITTSSLDLKKSHKSAKKRKSRSKSKNFQLNTSMRADRRYEKYRRMDEGSKKSQKFSQIKKEKVNRRKINSFLQRNEERIQKKMFQDSMTKNLK